MISLFFNLACAIFMAVMALFAVRDGDAGWTAIFCFLASVNLIVALASIGAIS